MHIRRPLLLVGGGVIALLFLVIVLNSSLGVDSEVTFTDVHRPEIVGESGSLRP